MPDDLFSQIETPEAAPAAGPQLPAGTFLSPKMRQGRDQLRDSMGLRWYQEKVATYIQLIQEQQEKHNVPPLQALEMLTDQARKSRHVYSVWQLMLLNAAVVEIIEPTDAPGPGRPAAVPQSSETPS